MSDDNSLELLLGRLDIPKSTIEPILSFIESVRPLHIPHLTPKQEFRFAKEMERTADALGPYAEEDLPYVLQKIQEAPSILIPHLRFTLALHASKMVARQGVRGIHEYLETVQQISEQSVFAAAGFTDLTEEELAASPISYDALIYATARGAMKFDGTLGINLNGEASINNYDAMVGLSRNILAAFATYPREYREEAAYGALPFYCEIAPRSVHAISFLKRFGEVYGVDTHLPRPFGVACARIKNQGTSLVQALEVASNAQEQVNSVGVRPVQTMWEGVAEIARPHWSIITSAYMRQCNSALLDGDADFPGKLFEKIRDRKSGKEVYAILHPHHEGPAPIYCPEEE